MTDETESWLPNLIGGVSIWKLAPDLNEEQFFDGRLLVPETEGSDSLPVRVEWDLTGMIPLPEARERHPAEVTSAVGQFFTCLERTAKVFEAGGSGYDKYKAAFTVPALDADGGAHYFYDPSDDKLKVINWGASPRKIKHEKQYLFGYQDFGALIEKEQEAAAARGDVRKVGGATSAASSAAVGGVAGAAAEANEGTQKEEQRKEEAAEEEKGTLWGRPWWVWILYLVGLLFLLGLLLVFLEDCSGAGSDRGDAGVADGGVADDGAADGGPQAIYGESVDDGGPAATDMRRDGSVADRDAGPVADGGPASADAGAITADAGRGRDAGAGAGTTVNGSGGGSGDGPVIVGPPRRADGRIVYGEHRDPEGRYRYWIPGADGRGVSLPSRVYFHAEAMQWRIVGGTGKVYDFSSAGSEFRVFLHPGEDFDGVVVQWRDRAGDWHDH